MASRPRVLFVTDLGYEARGRRYCDEDIFLSSRLREHFDVALCHPEDAAALMDDFDVLVVRNTGPVIQYQEAYDAFRRQALARGTLVFTELTGKADQAGKQYLVDLSSAGHPVIPTVDAESDLDRLPAVDEYVAKPKLGADSVGLRFLGSAELSSLVFDETLVQPRIDFDYEVSFYFVGRRYEYALYAPDPGQRWVLTPYEPSSQDLEFAQRFVDWNDIEFGIQRVDACRTKSGELLLVELEDLNPYLSLDLVSEQTRARFIADMSTSISAMVDRGRRPEQSFAGALRVS